MMYDEILTVKETAVLLKTTQDDRKRRTPCREGRQGVEDSIGKYTHVYRRKSRINLLLLVLEIKEFIYRRIECLRDSQECCQ